MLKTNDPRYAKRTARGGIVINIDEQGYAAHKAERENYIRMTKAVSEVETLKNQVDTLTSMMQQLLSQQNKQNGTN